jgi:hypothetical protein
VDDQANLGERTNVLQRIAIRYQYIGDLIPL